MKPFITLLIAATLSSSCTKEVKKQAVDYVNPYMGNISHLLVPTYPAVHLPNSMLRVRPQRASYTESRIDGLQVMMYSHRMNPAFRISCYQGDKGELEPVISNYYDNEVVKPYFYSVYLDRDNIDVQFAPSHQSALYQIAFEGDNKDKYLVFHAENGELKYNNQFLSGFEDIGHQTRVYWYLKLDVAPEKVGYFQNGLPVFKAGEGLEDADIILDFGKQAKRVTLKYGVSFISVDQAKQNLGREIGDRTLDQVAQTGRSIWNSTLNKIRVQGGAEVQKTVFYTSLYRSYERPVNISEDGKYW
ncbi:MAG: glycoside hydrolase family 92 protein, partial [Bacteroidetes bacterium]|nr:glycoside hydrolase family 92 protein [Bacteroidota bacterium]